MTLDQRMAVALKKLNLAVGGGECIISDPGYYIHYVPVKKEEYVEHLEQLVREKEAKP